MILLELFEGMGSYADKAWKWRSLSYLDTNFLRGPQVEILVSW